MEVYEDPGKYCVTPDMRLCVIDDRYEHLNHGIKQLKARLIQRLEARYEAVPALRQSLPIVKRTHAAAYATLSEAGASLTFRPFAENIPNWPEIRANGDIRILIFMEVAGTRWLGERAVLVRLFGESAVQRQYDRFIHDGQFFDLVGTVPVGGHEIAHGALTPPDCAERLTPPLYAKLEEHKANITVLSQLDSLYSAEQCRLIVLYELGYSLMKMQQVDEPTVEAYVNYAVFALRTFLQSGMLVSRHGQFTLDTDPEKVNQWIALAQAALDALVPIYDHGTATEARAYMASYFTRTPEVEQIIALVAEQ